MTVSVAASSDATLATNVFLGQDAHDGMTLLGTETTLKDGQVLTNRHTPEGHYTFGDIIAGDYRSMSYTYGAGPGDAVRTIHHQARSDNSGIRFTQATIVVDGTPPPNPWGLHSTTHPLGGWSNSRTLGFAWSQAPDNLSGLAGYCDGRSGSLPVGVPPVLVLPPVTTSTMTVGADYTTLWYGLRAVDQSGELDVRGRRGTLRHRHRAPPSAIEPRIHEPHPLGLVQRSGRRLLVQPGVGMIGRGSPDTARPWRRLRRTRRTPWSSHPRRPERP